MKPKITKETLEKIRKRRLFKLRGKIEDTKWISQDSVIRIVVYKGVGKKKSIYAFTAFGSMAMELSKLKKNDRIKVWFKIETKKVDKIYYNNLIIEDHEIWIVNEDKIAKEKKQKTSEDNREYLKSSADNNDLFLNHGQGPLSDQE